MAPTQHPAGRVSSLARLRLGALGIGPEQADFVRRGFALVPGAQARLEQVGRAFIHGYRAALQDDDAGALERALAPVDDELRGFAYEGAAMGVMLRDRLAPWRASRFDRLLAGPAGRHVYMLHVGAGWALARLRRGPGSTLGLDPLLRWLALDGYGFHEGYFRHARSIARQLRPRGFTGYAGRAFDQGLRRSMWFVTAAQPGSIAAAIGRFDERRHPDLWSGVGLAAAYAGPAGLESLRILAAAASGHGEHLAQGAAFAAAARQRAGNPAAHTGLACRLLTGLSERDADELVARAARDLPRDGAEPAYELWRRRLRTALAAPPSRAAAKGGTA
jgi:hypothetical protein